MASCCDPNGLAGVFDAKRARSDARDYRRNGLDRRSRAILDFLVAKGIAGGTILEIGGGVGALQLDLLRAGAASAVNVEISPAYEEAARELAVEAGVADRVDRRVGDFAARSESIDRADAVVLHRVVCCYPDLPALLRPAATHAKRWLVLTFPAGRWWIRCGVGLVNAAQRLFRTKFRFFFHEPAAILGIARAAGLEPVLVRRGLFWETLALERS
ncbi:MAG: methyltransferase domain-containing protein [Chloroflexota bacterium]|nr:methyltransferase domain-containing protein [Chloroflexota bacterium]